MRFGELGLLKYCVRKLLISNKFGLFTRYIMHINCGFPLFAVICVINMQLTHLKTKIVLFFQAHWYYYCCTHTNILLRMHSIWWNVSMLDQWEKIYFSLMQTWNVIRAGRFVTCMFCSFDFTMTSSMVNNSCNLTYCITLAKYQITWVLSTRF